MTDMSQVVANPNPATARRRPPARLVAFYLPQFHPIPENDRWWGKGFTEWTNVAKAKPLFGGHYQPHIPANLGFYDLRVPETRAAQAELARSHGIEGFCYWHYWFAGKQLLERPFNEVLKSGEPDFPFCIAWANQTWSGIWHGRPNEVLIEQTYPGLHDHEAHFYQLLTAFSDERYITVDGRPLFIVYRPRELPDPKRVTEFWRTLAHREGLKGLYLVGNEDEFWNPLDHGFDASVSTKIPRLEPWASWRHPFRKVKQWYGGRLTIYQYEDVLPWLLADKVEGFRNYPCLIPNWDNTPRSGRRGLVLHGSTPELFSVHLRDALRRVEDEPEEHRLIFIKSWNEWAEGNYLEPDLKFGRGYLEVIRKELFEVSAR
jgi:hypothetical protein